MTKVMKTGTLGVTNTTATHCFTGHLHQILSHLRLNKWTHEHLTFLLLLFVVTKIYISLRCYYFHFKLLCVVWSTIMCIYAVLTGFLGGKHTQVFMQGGYPQVRATFVFR